MAKTYSRLWPRPVGRLAPLVAAAFFLAVPLAGAQDLAWSHWRSTYTALDGRPTVANVVLQGGTGTYTITGGQSGYLSNVQVTQGPTGAVIQGDWNMTGVGGRFTWYVSQDGSSFHGPWNTHAGARGQWSGTRTAFAGYDQGGRGTVAQNQGPVTGGFPATTQPPPVTVTNPSVTFNNPVTQPTPFNPGLPQNPGFGNPGMGGPPLDFGGAGRTGTVGSGGSQGAGGIAIDSKGNRFVIGPNGQARPLGNQGFQQGFQRPGLQQQPGFQQGGFQQRPFFPNR